MTTTPTPEDFERARAALVEATETVASEYVGERLSGIGLGRSWSAWNEALDAYVATRLSAAERRLEAWGPIVRAGFGILASDGDDQDAAISRIERLCRDLTADLKPEVTP